MLHGPGTFNHKKRLALGFLVLLMVATDLKPMPVSSANLVSPNFGPNYQGDWYYLYFPVVYRFFVSKIYCMGDSLTLAGVYEIELIKLLGPAWMTINKGKSGDSTTGMLARFQTDVIDPGDAAYVIIWGGTNDLRWLPKDVTEDSLQAMYTMAHNAGIKVVAVTITPYNEESELNKIKLLEINAWIQNTAIDVNYVADAYTAVEDPYHPGYILPVYDSGDHVHLSYAGYTKVATTIYNAVTWIPGP